jgi:hypothetical protein
LDVSRWRAKVLLQATEPLGAIADVQQRIAMAYDLVAQESHTPLPDVEKFPVHFYEDGILSLETALKLRQIVAFEHWQGNTAYTLGDVMKKIIPEL